MKFLKSCGVWALSALMICLSGCVVSFGEKPEPTAYRVVWKVHVSRQNGDEVVQRIYSAPEAVQEILNYLRLVDPYGAPGEDPVSQPGEEFRIRLEYSDGSTKTYRQRCDRYLQVEDGPWRRIAPERGQELKKLLETLDRGEIRKTALLS